MKRLKYIKTFESHFVSKEDIDQLLDKISSSGITSLSDIDRNRLTLFSEVDIIDKMGDITIQFKNLNKEIRRQQDEGISDGFHLMDDWMKLNNKLRPLEASFKKWGIELGDHRLSNLMNKVRPDAYGNIMESKEVEEEINLKFEKLPRKKDAKTDTYDVIKDDNIIGQIKWSSRMRGYAFLPSVDCSVKIKEFIKDLMDKRKEEKHKS